MKPTLLVLAAGMGSRYGGVKQIDAIGKNGECLLDYATFDAIKAGFGKVVYIIRKDIEKDFKERVFDRISRNINAEYVFQTPEACFTEDELKIVQSTNRSKPWGTIQAVLCAEEKIKEPFITVNADDYYGRTAFESMSNYFSSINNDSDEHAMVGYTLEKTMSRNGSVSRGVVQVKNGYLTSIVENKKIYYTGENFSGDEIVSEIDGKVISLSKNDTVSMNLFGFTPKIFGNFKAYWETFKKTSITNPTSEALLSIAMNEIIKNNEAKMKVFTSKESWFGMTYQQDKQFVIDEITKKIDSGYYPEKLWEK